MLPDPSDIILVPPLLEGPYAKIYKQDLAASRLATGTNPASDPTIASYVIEAPWANHAWSSYWLCVIHLRPLDPPKETKFVIDGATHEMWVFALEPGRPRQAMIDTGSMSLMTPINFASQMKLTDQEVIDLLEKDTLPRIVEGELSPDAEAVPSWVSLFGDSMMIDRSTKH